jgi:hypothetical protein
MGNVSSGARFSRENMLDSIEHDTLLFGSIEHNSKERSIKVNNRRFSVQTYFISYCKWQPPICVEFTVRATSKQEARLIAEKEMARMNGYRFLGSN